MVAWDKARFAVERRCTCRSRWSECASGWHRVDGWDTEAAALNDAYSMGFDMYRVVDSQTGAHVSYGLADLAPFHPPPPLRSLLRRGEAVRFGCALVDPGQR